MHIFLGILKIIFIIIAVKFFLAIIMTMGLLLLKIIPLKLDIPYNRLVMDKKSQCFFQAQNLIEALAYFFLLELNDGNVDEILDKAHQKIIKKALQIFYGSVFILFFLIFPLRMIPYKWEKYADARMLNCDNPIDKFIAIGIFASFMIFIFNLYMNIFMAFFKAAKNGKKRREDKKRRLEG